MNEERGAYAYFEGGEPRLFLYGRLDPEHLQRALPLEDTAGSTHLGAHFVKSGMMWFDYVGAMTVETIQATLDTAIMIHIDDVDQDSDELRWMVEFSRLQLSTLPGHGDDCPTGEGVSDAN